MGTRKGSGRGGRTVAAVPVPVPVPVLRLTFVLVVGLVAFSVRGWCQLPERRADTASQRFRASSQVVLLNVHVADTEGKPLGGLVAEDFVVSEDGEVQPLSFFASPRDHESVPSSVLLLVDTSSSITGAEMERVRRAAKYFLATLSEDDEVAVAAFDDRMHPVCDFTRDRASVEDAVDRLAPSGGTALYDALFDAVGLLESATYPRGVVFLFTDGKDLDSGRRFEEVERRLEASAVVVYAVGQYEDARRKLYMTGEKYFKPPEFEVNLNPVWALRRLAELSGGRAVFPERKESLSPFLASAGSDWSRVYILGYPVSVAPMDADGEEASARWHTIEIKLDPARFPEATYVVRTRHGYRR